MRPLVELCRGYQKLFHHGHPEEARLVDLCTRGETETFLHEYFEHQYRKGLEMLDRFSAWSQTWPMAKALDFGCGAGGLTCRIAARVREAIGIDIERAKLEHARSQSQRLGLGNVTFLEYDGSRLPFDDASVDIVFCVDVIEHLPSPEAFVAEWARCLKPGGLLLLSFGPPWGHPHGKHLWARLPGWWTHLLFPQKVVMEAGGFPPERTWEELGLHRLTVGKFERIMRASSFETIRQETRIKSVLTPLKFVPGVRELFISGVIGVYRRPA